MTPTEQKEYVESTRGIRVRLLAIWLGAMASVPMLGVAARAYGRHVAPLPVCEQLPWMRLSVAVVSLLFLLYAAWMASYAWRVRSSGRVPPPDAWVFFRTRVYRGWIATAYSIFAGIASMATIGLTIYGVIYVSSGWFFLSESQCVKQEAFEQAKREACRSANASKAENAASPPEAEQKLPQNATSDAVRSDAQRESR